MLLLSEVLEVSSEHAISRVSITEQSSFFRPDKNGVSASIALEYMGQTAGLSEGFRLRNGLSEPHLAFFLGTRRFESKVPLFRCGDTLRVHAFDAVFGGSGFVKFKCTVHSEEDQQLLCEATLSVFRKPLNEPMQ